MKIKAMKKQKPGASGPAVIEAEGVQLPIDEAARLRAVMDDLNNVVVGRDDEILALSYCLATGHHLMLEGEPGAAKSMLAREAFSRVGSSKVFSRQFMKGTQLDEIFGPMNSEKYRQQAVWEYNTAGMLPECEFAFLDEVYRASDSALPSMLQILNERTFHNGAKLMRCPLHTAIGTTNYITDTEELKAFHDRWLIRMKVRALDNTPSKIRMLTQFIQPIESEVEPMPLEQVRTITKSVPKVAVSAELLELFVQTVDTYRKSLSNRPISERRLCQTLLLVQAEALFCRKSEVEAEHLRAAKFGVATFGDRTQTEAFDQAFTVVVGAYIQESEERSTLKSISGYCSKLVEAYDDSLSPKAKANLMNKCLQALEGLNNMTPEETPKTRSGLDAVAELRRKLTEVAETIRQSTGAVRTR